MKSGTSELASFQVLILVQFEIPMHTYRVQRHKTQEPVASDVLFSVSTSIMLFHLEKVVEHLVNYLFR